MPSLVGPAPVPVSDPFRALTPVKRKALLKQLRKSLSRPYACALIRFSYNTLKKMMDKGKRDTEDYEEYACPLTVYAEFYLDVMEAEAIGVERYRKEIDARVAANPILWAEKMTFKQRTDPDRFGMRQAIKVEQDTKIQIEFVERDGNDWLSGGRNVEVIESHTVPMLTAGEDDIIDTSLVGSEVTDG